MPPVIIYINVDPQYNSFINTASLCSRLMRHCHFIQIIPLDITFVTQFNQIIFANSLLPVRVQSHVHTNIRVRIQCSFYAVNILLLEVLLLFQWRGLRFVRVPTAERRGGLRHIQFNYDWFCRG